jgi:UDP-glucose 4-epimerase
MSILVTGGAGYIGSVTVEYLLKQGEDVVVLDNLSRGNRAAVSPEVDFYEGNVGDAELVKRIVTEHDVDCCVHFAAFAYVGESVEHPELYWENNVSQGIRLLDALRESGVRRFVFSSTCATYGEPQEIPMSEAHPQWPANPYGWSKFIIERTLESYDSAHELRFVALRYFNAAGATVICGEDHDPESHLIPCVLFAAQGRRSHVSVFGDAYPTPDGTAVRDYVHVEDLASAHFLALKHLRGGGNSEFVNLGTGHGYSVLQVIEEARRVTGIDIEARMEPARAGDPSHLVAANAKARKLIGWQPQHNDLGEIVRSAWEWFEAHPEGYGAKTT